MNVADLDLCKELYELSGWDDEELHHHLYGEIRVDRLFEHDLKGKDKKEDTDYTPLYDLGYLLDKLPHFIELVQLSGGYTPSGWLAIKRSSQDFWHKGGPIEAKADNPTDAACKLAIELSKQGILK